MEWFCTEKDRAALEKRGRKLTAVFRILAASAVIAFIVLCFLIRTENAQRMHLVLIAVMALTGWVCIMIRQLGIKENRMQLGHLKMLCEGEKDFIEGRITLTGESVQIPKSIRIRKILLNADSEEPVRLNLDEEWISRIPPDGSRVRLAVAHSYVAGLETLEEAPGKRSENRIAVRLRSWAKLIPLLGIWLLAAVIFGSFVFYQITDTDPAHKITIYVDGTVRNEAQLAARLEKELPDSIRMVQIHPFSYAMFGSAALKGADLFIVPDSDRDQFADWFVPAAEGVPVYEPGAGISVAGTWILYQPDETYRLYTGAGSPHLEDGLAYRAAELLTMLKTDKEEVK
ncbi:MAG: hypothetical protein K6F61_09070 [Clostridiales bacterium]|nr:hypothetical protein [Clostridiales bacterium]